MKKKTVVHTSTTAYGVITDEITGKKLNASVGFNCGKICINIEGYGDALSTENQGQPVVIDLFDNKLQVIVWGDINQEEPTHKIDLEGAREICRKESEIVSISKSSIKEIDRMLNMNSKSKHNYLKKIYEELRNMRAVLRMFVDAPTAGNLKVLVDHEKYFTKSTKKIEKFFSDNYAELPRKFTDDREDGSNFRGMCVHVINNTISDAKDVLMMSNKKG